jgi:DnaJ-class molecular chaperone
MLVLTSGPLSEFALLIDENAAFVECGSKSQRREQTMANEKGPNIKKKQKCKNCEGKGLLKKGDKVVKCQRCGGTGVR